MNQQFDIYVRGCNVDNVCFFLQKQDANWSVAVQRPCVQIQKKDDSNGGRGTSDTLLSRLRPFRSSSSAAASLVAMTASDPVIVTRREESEYRM